MWLQFAAFSVALACLITTISSAKIEINSESETNGSRTPVFVFKNPKTELKSKTLGPKTNKTSLEKSPRLLKSGNKLFRLRYVPKSEVDTSKLKDLNPSDAVQLELVVPHEGPSNDFPRGNGFNLEPNNNDGPFGDFNGPKFGENQFIPPPPPRGDFFNEEPNFNNDGNFQEFSREKKFSFKQSHEFGPDIPDGRTNTFFTSSESNVENGVPETKFFSFEQDGKSKPIVKSFNSRNEQGPSNFNHQGPQNEDFQQKFNQGPHNQGFQQNFNQGPQNEGFQQNFHQGPQNEGFQQKFNQGPQNEDFQQNFHQGPQNEGFQPKFNQGPQNEGGFQQNFNQGPHNEGFQQNFNQGPHNEGFQQNFNQGPKNEGFKPNFNHGPEDEGFQQNFNQGPQNFNEHQQEHGFQNQQGGSFEHRDEGRFEHQQEDGFQNQQGGSFKHRNEGRFEHQQEGGFQNQQGGSFEHRNEGRFEHRQEEGFQRHQQFVNNDNSNNFRPNFDNDGPKGNFPIIHNNNNDFNHQNGGPNQEFRPNRNFQEQGFNSHNSGSRPGFSDDRNEGLNLEFEPPQIFRPDDDRRGPVIHNNNFGNNNQHINNEGPREGPQHVPIQENHEGHDGPHGQPLPPVHNPQPFGPHNSNNNGPHHNIQVQNVPQIQQGPEYRPEPENALLPIQQHFEERQPILQEIVAPPQLTHFVQSPVGVVDVQEVHVEHPQRQEVLVQRQPVVTHGVVDSSPKHLQHQEFVDAVPVSLVEAVPIHTQHELVQEVPTTPAFKGRAQLPTISLDHARQIAAAPEYLESQDYSAIPGVPGVDYQLLTEVPATSFSCQSQAYPGYYADLDSGCQAFHVCDQNNPTAQSFLCPVGTLFDQTTFVCNWYFNVDCNSSPDYYSLNQLLYIEGPSSHEVVQEPVAYASTVDVSNDQAVVAV